MVRGNTWFRLKSKKYACHQKYEGRIDPPYYPARAWDIEGQDKEFGFCFRERCDMLATITWTAVDAGCRDEDISTSISSNRALQKWRETTLAYRALPYNAYEWRNFMRERGARESIWYPALTGGSTVVTRGIRRVLRMQVIKEGCSADGLTLGQLGILHSYRFRAVVVVLQRYL